MTLCIALSTNRGIWIGTDSGSSTDEITDICSHPKLWRSNGWLVASAGNWRALEIIRYDLEFPNPYGNHHRALCMDLNTELTKAFERNNYEMKRNGDGDVVEEEAHYILAARDNKLFYIDYDGHAEQMKRYAIGTGATYAMGIIDASDLGSAERRLKKSFVATAKRFRSIVGPFPVEKA